MKSHANTEIRRMVDLAKSRTAYEAWCQRKGLKADQAADDGDGAEINEVVGARGEKYPKQLSRTQYKGMTLSQQADFLDAGGQLVGEDVEAKEPQTPEEENRALKSQVQNLSDQVAKLTAIAEKQLALQTPKLTREKMSVSEKVDYIRTHGQSAYLALPFK